MILELSYAIMRLCGSCSSQSGGMTTSCWRRPRPLSHYQCLNFIHVALQKTRTLKNCHIFNKNLRFVTENITDLFVNWIFLSLIFLRKNSRNIFSFSLLQQNNAIVKKIKHKPSRASVICWFFVTCLAIPFQEIAVYNLFRRIKYTHQTNKWRLSIILNFVTHSLSDLILSIMIITCVILSLELT
jgi:hypothetical protein